MSETSAQSIVLIGSPNSGKSLLFNKLTGMHAEGGQFPGYYRGCRIRQALSHARTAAAGFSRHLLNCSPISGEEEVATAQFKSALDDPSVTQVFCLIDVTRLEKSLYFTLQVIRECERHGKQVMVLANMMDVLDKHGINVDLDGLAAEIKAPVFPISARSGKGIDEVLHQVRNNLSNAKSGMDKQHRRHT